MCFTKYWDCCFLLYSRYRIIMQIGELMLGTAVYILRAGISREATRAAQHFLLLLSSNLLSSILFCYSSLAYLSIFMHPQLNTPSTPPILLLLPLLRKSLPYLSNRPTRLHQFTNSQKFSLSPQQNSYPISYLTSHIRDLL